MKERYDFADSYIFIFYRLAYRKYHYHNITQNASLRITRQQPYLLIIVWEASDKEICKQWRIEWWKRPKIVFSSICDSLCVSWFAFKHVFLRGAVVTSRLRFENGKELGRQAHVTKVRFSLDYDHVFKIFGFVSFQCLFFFCILGTLMTWAWHVIRKEFCSILPQCNP